MISYVIFQVLSIGACIFPFSSYKFVTVKLVILEEKRHTPPPHFLGIRRMCTLLTCTLRIYVFPEFSQSLDYFKFHKLYSLQMTCGNVSSALPFSIAWLIEMIQAFSPLPLSISIHSVAHSFISLPFDYLIWKNVLTHPVLSNFSCCMRE